MSTSPVMKTEGKAFLDLSEKYENNCNRVETESEEVGQDDDRISFDYHVQHSIDGEYTEDKKTEDIDIVDHYTDENGIRSSIGYETGEMKREVGLNESNTFEHAAEIEPLSSEHASSHKDQISNYVDPDKKTEDIKTEDIDIVDHYTDENGIRLSIGYETGKMKREVGLNESNTFEHAAEIEPLSSEHASSHKDQIRNNVDPVPSKEKEHKCHLCEFITNRKGNLNVHLKCVHLNKREHKCHLCNYTTNRKGTLKGHLEAVHLNKREYKCELCDYAANRKGTLESHIETVHLNKKEHKCQFCDYATNYRSNLKKHINNSHLYKQ